MNEKQKIEHLEFRLDTYLKLHRSQEVEIGIIQKKNDKLKEEIKYWMNKFNNDTDYICNSIPKQKVSDVHKRILNQEPFKSSPLKNALNVFAKEYKKQLLSDTLLGTSDTSSDDSVGEK